MEVELLVIKNLFFFFITSATTPTFCIKLII